MGIFWKRVNEKNRVITEYIVKGVLDRLSKMPLFSKLLESEDARKSFYNVYYAFIYRSYAPLLAAKLVAGTKVEGIKGDLKTRLDLVVGQLVNKASSSSGKKALKLTLKKLKKNKDKAEKLKKKADKKVEHIKESN